MASLRSGPISESIRRKPFLIDKRPPMLKDFLRDDLNSCSSNGFQSYPRRSCCTTVRNLLDIDFKSRESSQRRRLVRSRSKAASTTISALHKASEAVLAAVKYFPFSPINKSPSTQPQNRPKVGILPRSISRRLRRSFWRKTDKEEHEIIVTVRVKDILRWKSFRDLIEDSEKPSDFSPTPLNEKAKPLCLSSSPLPRTTTTTTTTTTSSSITSSSNSWADSDFTSDYLQSSSVSSECLGETDGEDSKRCLSSEKQTFNNKAGEGSMETTTTYSVDAKSACQYEEKEQFSPVSVLDFPFEEEDEDTETHSSSNQSLSNMDWAKQKLMQKIRRFEIFAQLEPVELEQRIALAELDDSVECASDSFSISVHDDTAYQRIEEDEEAIEAEERAMRLFNKHIKASSQLQNRKASMEHVLLDFFRNGIMGRTQAEEGDEFECELLKVARDWVDGKKQYELGRGFGDDRSVCVREMESGGQWKKLEEEQRELAAEMEIKVWGSLVDELLLDLLS
uniref:Uncharacterized protein LOC104612690 n=2 Tax=Nelumbo nucifera TaxID=4432 RepID=A0A1U8QCB8_NELNU|nr:TPA_asm: hypothetical protein HUJ06_017966 [Nelumbo nucifera]